MQIFTADKSWTQLIARLTLGIVILPHGLQKSFGIFGGHGINETIDSFYDWFNIPVAITFAVIFFEFVGSILLILGLASRIMALGILCVMLGAMYYVVHDYFFMNWYDTQNGEGFEYHLLVIGLALTIMVGGSGRLSIDGFISKSSG